jgi:hypothetical protein
LIEDELAQVKRLAGDMREQLVATRRHNNLLTGHLRDITNSPWVATAKSGFESLEEERISILTALDEFRHSVLASKQKFIS